MKLLEIKDGEKVYIDNIPDDEAGMRLEALGLRSGKVVTKVSSMPFNGPVTVLLDGRHFAISHAIASEIRVLNFDKCCKCQQKNTQKGNS
ncbi:MAG: FeoA family protein [Synergistaceae bacterium]